MRKEIYKTLLSLEGINPELIEWKKVVKYAPKELFTEEFVNEHKEELYKNGFVIKRPKLSIKFGMMEDFINTLDEDNLEGKNEKWLDSIIERIDSVLVGTSLEGNENFVRLIKVITDRFPEKESFIMKFFNTEDELSLVDSDMGVIKFQLMISNSIYYSRFSRSDIQKLKNIFINKYSDENEAMVKMANFIMSLYQRKIVDGEFMLRVATINDTPIFSDDEIKKIIDETPLTLLTKGYPSTIYAIGILNTFTIRERAFTNYKQTFNKSDDMLLKILNDDFSLDND